MNYRTNEPIDILESDLPIEVGTAIKNIIPATNSKKKYLGKKKI